MPPFTSLGDFSESFETCFKLKEGFFYMNMSSMTRLITILILYFILLINTNVNIHHTVVLLVVYLHDLQLYILKLTIIIIMA